MDVALGPRRRHRRRPRLLQFPIVVDRSPLPLPVVMGSSCSLVDSGHTGVENVRNVVEVESNVSATLHVLLKAIQFTHRAQPRCAQCCTVCPILVPRVSRFFLNVAT